MAILKRIFFCLMAGMADSEGFELRFILEKGRNVSRVACKCLKGLNCFDKVAKCWLFFFQFIKCVKRGTVCHRILSVIKVLKNSPFSFKFSFKSRSEL